MTDSIDSHLLDYYQRELSYLRHAGSAFAERYPKIARRLELVDGECPDPHVERLLEGFALLSARLQRRLDDDYSELTDALLEQLYPHAMRPMPSCAIAVFEPDPTKGNVAAGYTIARDTPLFITTTKGETIHFRTTAPATLWPLAIEDAEFLPAEEAQNLTGLRQARAALKLTVRCIGKDHWPALPIQTLRVHLSGTAVTAAGLYDLLAAHAMLVACSVPGTPIRPVPGGLPQPVGFDPTEALLPPEDGQHPAYRLLVEYFACPEKFAFFDIPVRVPADATDTLDIVIPFDQAPAGRISVQREDFELGCVPVVNLFPRTSEPLRPDSTRSEYRVIADAYRENSVEIYAIRALRAGTDKGATIVPPYFALMHGSHSHSAASGLYWHARRVNGLTPNRRGSDMLLTLVDTHFNPADAPAKTLTAELLCTNRSLAESLPPGSRLSFELPGPVARISLLRPPRPQTMPPLGGASRWKLISQLSLNHLSLVEGEQALAALQEILALHNLTDEAAARRQIDGIAKLSSERVVDHVGRDAWRGWRNGLEVRLTIDAQHFVGGSPVLFSGVLAHFFSLYANANRFIRTVLETPDREIKTWQPLVGQPLVL
ncbi:type VI secretion system baseplate subunit TssF [Andreprevotia chitinilytica]|uniref:type VI secretion system baseplate subunit TssF n=1 Tax=Andreprevotia chitinilytica TaxID=396808 RepID=UPI000554587E|nr:type VI secretion system baseplate subunit TssF [Andreprevotia chitinilytica]